MRCLLLLAIVCLASAQPEICTAGDHNIEPLLRSGYWQINLLEVHCKNFGFTSTCTLFVAFCQRLPDTISGCDTSEDELGPISLCVSNGTNGYSMGAYNNSLNPFEMSINSSILAAQWGDGSLVGGCVEGGLTTNIGFKCDAYSMWERSPTSAYGEASAYLKEFYVNLLNPCGVFITLGYSKVCKPALCGADHHDTNTLSSPDYWQVSNIPETSCRKFFQGGTCTLYFSFCKPLTGIDHCKDFVNTTICITNGTIDYSLGSYYYLVNPFSGVSDTSLLATYKNGSHYPKCPVTYTSRLESFVTLQCALGATWSQSGDKGDVSNYFTAILPNLADACEIFIELTYSGACVTAPSSKNDNDNVGWPGLIILLLLAVVVTIYLVIGSIYNIARGKSGCPEMLPQYEFWKSFFMSAIEGVFFTANLVTCGLCSQQVGTPPATQYDKL